MEEKKLDLNSIIGFGLIFIILIWVMYNSQQKELEEQIKKQETEKVAPTTTSTTEVPKKESVATVVDSTVSDSIQTLKLQSSLGSFAYSAALPTATEAAFTVLENDLVRLKIANKGGYIVEAEMKKFEQFHKGSAQNVQIIKENNASFSIELKTSDNRTLQTKDLFFEPKLTEENGNQILSLKLKASPTQFLEYRYVLKPNDYMLDFGIRSQGLDNIINTSNPLNLDWQLKAFRNEKTCSL